jgi:hypothetical protein
MGVLTHAPGPAQPARTYQDNGAGSIAMLACNRIQFEIEPRLLDALNRIAELELKVADLQSAKGRHT